METGWGSWSCSARVTLEHFQVPKGAYERAGNQHFTRACSERTWGHDFMPKCRRVPGFKIRLSMALGSGLVDNVPAHCRGVELDELYKAYDKAKMSYDSVNNFINQHLKFSLNNLWYHIPMSTMTAMHFCSEKPELILWINVFQRLWWSIGKCFWGSI